MDDTGQRSASRQIQSITGIGVIVNIGLFVVKVAVGLIGGSVALVADGIHSLSDMVTDVAVLVGHFLGSRGPDDTHPYGHGKFETFSAGVIGLFLIAVGGGMIYYAAIDIAKGRAASFSTSVMVVAALSVVAKELLYQATKRVAMRLHSAALYANAWHHRSDAFSSVAVLIGFASLRFGFDYGDQIAAIAVGVMVILVAARVLGDCLGELAERAIDRETLARIEQVINSDTMIRSWHKLRTRAVGREVFLDLHILVDPELDITAAHRICERLEESLAEQIARPANITVHVEPDLPELRT